MGMAASQARFLGLTARKSNVEYQGQQINQQRTALSNESANLYNQMLELTVPTPPSTNEFYETVYTIDGTKETNMTGDYKITKAVKTYNKSNEYKVTLEYTEAHIKAISEKYEISKVSYNPSATEDKDPDNTSGNDKKGVYTFPISSPGSTSFSKNLYYDEAKTSAIETDDKGNKKISAETWNIYKLSSDDDKTNSTITGYNEWVNSLSEAEKTGEYYFYQDNAGDAHFITASQFETMKGLAGQEGTHDVNFGKSYTYNKDYTTYATASIETSSKGRYSSIQFYDDEETPASLRGAEHSITIKQEMNQDAYDDAYNDYEYEKSRYEKAISDINAQTEIIQNEDQQLELRLQQLNTEQNAISTEMDSVSKVIEDNVEKTFKVFA